MSAPLERLAAAWHRWRRRATGPPFDWRRDAPEFARPRECHVRVMP
jgi:hypothetical protein